MTQVIKAHFRVVASLDFSPDGTVLATGSLDETTKLWNTQTWLMQGNTIHCCGTVCCNRYSPSGEILAIATDRNIQIYDAGTVHCIANLAGRTSYAYNFFLAWTLDSTRLLSGPLSRIPAYGSGIHQLGRSVTHGLAILALCLPLLFILLVPSLLPHLVTTMSASGGSQIDKPSLSSRAPMTRCA